MPNDLCTFPSCNCFDTNVCGKGGKGEFARKANEQDIIKGRIEAFDFLAEQLRTYASDNAEVTARYGGSQLHKIKEGYRRDTWLQLAKECEEYALTQRKALEGRLKPF